MASSSDSNQSQGSVMPPTSSSNSNESKYGVMPSSSISDSDQSQQAISLTSRSAPAVLSGSTGKGRANNANASSSFVIPMHSEGADAVGGDGGVCQHQIVVNGVKENNLLTATAPSAAAQAVNDGGTGGTAGTSQQRRRRHSNSVPQSADRLSRTARRTSRPRNTTTRRHTQGMASFVAAAAAAAGVQSSGTANPSNSNSTNRDSVVASTDCEEELTLASSSSNSADNENADGNATNWRQQLNSLIGMRHVLVRRIIEQFPSLYMVGSLFCAVFVLLVVLMHFFVHQLVATLALLFSAAHFNDAFAFKRLVTGGQPSGWLIAFKLLFRQFVLGTLLGQTPWALPSLVFHQLYYRQQPQQHQAVITPTPSLPVSTEGAGDGVIGTFWPPSTVSPVQSASLSSPTFSSTLYLVILAQFFVMDLLLLVKIGVSALPSSWFGAATKRRIYQWAEYTCALYRFALPFGPWNAYFNAIWWTVLYGGIKLLFGFALVWAWLLATLRFVRSSHIGSLASESEYGQGEQCTICFSDYRLPIKLKCSHIFCTECIRTWLDREVTCPICRTVVTREDNHFRNGESMMPCVF